MYEIIFYGDKSGRREIEEFLLDLKKRADNGNKDARVNLNKMVAYIDILAEMGTKVGEPVSKYLQGEIWELRPLKNRILYVYYADSTFIFLHHFRKKTQKTPRSEIQKAIKNLKDYREREGK